MSHHTRVDTPFLYLALEVIFSSEMNFVNFHCLHKHNKTGFKLNLCSIKS